jgi:hypothetical protein
MTAMSIGLYDKFRPFEIRQAFTTVVDTYTAGDPQQDDMHWTYLTRSEIAAALADEGFPVSVTVVDRLLEESEMRLRKALKTKTMRHDARSQRAVRAHRRAAEGVPRRRAAGALDGHEKEGNPR